MHYKKASVLGNALSSLKCLSSSSWRGLMYASAIKWANERIYATFRMYISDFHINFPWIYCGLCICFRYEVYWCIDCNVPVCFQIWNSMRCPLNSYIKGDDASLLWSWNSTCHCQVVFWWRSQFWVCVCVCPSNLKLPLQQPHIH